MTTSLSKLATCYILVGMKEKQKDDRCSNGVNVKSEEFLPGRGLEVHIS